jgi:DNA repair exonuclease SbcCD ATPase subunit
MILLRRLRVHALKHLRDADIWFPRHGSVLIEGHNESGKSTLFEAIYFALYGAPLVGEEGLASLIPHGEMRALVGLTLLAGDTELEIRRELSAGKRQKHDARLVVRRPVGQVEELHTVAAVNARILQELHGLDGSALRNSCLMEQQALDRIEALSREAREDAIARLLGLDALRRATRELQPVRANEMELEVLRARYEVAQSQSAAREASQRETDSAEHWRAAAVMSELRERDGLLAERSRVDAESTHDADRIECLQRRVEAARRAEALLARAEDAGRELARAREAGEGAAALQARLSALDRHMGDRLPAAEARVRALARLQPALVAADQHLAQLRAAARVVSEQAAAQEAAAAAQTAAEEVGREAEAAQTVAARAEAREALERWLQVAEASGPSEAQAHSDRAWAEYTAAQRRDAADHAQARVWLMLVLLAGAVALVTLLLGAASHGLWLVAAVAAVAAVLSMFLWRGAQMRLHAIAPELERVQRELQAALRDQGGNRELATMKAALSRIGMDVPPDAAAGRQLLAQLGTDQPPVAEARSRADEAAAGLEWQQSELRMAALELEHARQARLRANVPDYATSEDLEQQLSAAEVVQALVAEELAALGIAPSVEAVSAARGAAEADVQALRERDAERVRLTEEGRQSSARAAELRASCANRLASLIAESSAQDIVVQGVSAGFTDGSIEALQRAHDVLVGAVRAWLADLDAPGAQAELAALEVRREGQDARARDAQEEGARRAERIRELLAQQDVACMGNESLQALAARWPRLADADPDPDATERLRVAAERAHVDAEHARRSAAEVAARHRIDAEALATLDEEACRRAVADAERDLRRRRIAAELADEAFARIVRRVLPETEIHMRAILPELTAGRYRDVQLLHDDAHSADLRIRVWDQLAGRYVAKNLFSGGTRDQCSLALRLAFALATLPKELGAIPGFIFLDEPLSSFDAERAQALVQLLTRGTIARHFSQVFLISHSQSFDARSFSYRLQMAGGRIAETTLPRESEAQHLWAAEAAATQAP